MKTLGVALAGRKHDAGFFSAISATSPTTRPAHSAFKLGKCFRNPTHARFRRLSSVHLNPLDLVEPGWKKRGIADIGRAKHFLKKLAVINP